MFSSNKRAGVVLQIAGLAYDLKDDQFVTAMILPEHVGHVSLATSPSPSQTIYYARRSLSGKARTTGTPSRCFLGCGL